MSTTNIKNVITKYNEAKLALLEALKSIVENKGGKVKLATPYYFMLDDVEVRLTKLYISKEGNLYATYINGWVDNNILLHCNTIDSDYISDLLTYLM